MTSVDDIRKGQRLKQAEGNRYRHTDPPSPLLLAKAHRIAHKARLKGTAFPEGNRRIVRNRSPLVHDRSHRSVGKVAQGRFAIARGTSM